MESQELKRIFIHNNVELDDPDNNMTADNVLEFYSGQFPELTNAVTHGPEVKNDKIVYEFKTSVGTKG